MTLRPITRYETQDVLTQARAFHNDIDGVFQTLSADVNAATFTLRNYRSNVTMEFIYDGSSRDGDEWWVFTRTNNQTLRVRAWREYADVMWRNIREDTRVFDAENANREIMVATLAGVRVDVRANMIRADRVLEAYDEEVFAYAFVDRPEWIQQVLSQENASVIATRNAALSKLTAEERASLGW